MRIGFIGAGKVGCTLGKYFAVHGAEVAGYYDKDAQAAAEAAAFVGAEAYADPGLLLADCDAVFLTVPDGLITATYEALQARDLRGKILCHCSGSISSREAFPGIEETGAWACSVHPLFAVSSRFETWKEIGKAVFTLEGDGAYLKGNADRLSQMHDFLVGTGLRVQVIDPAAKIKYHLAAVYASNLVCGLLGEARRLLQDCGFPGETAIEALAPLIQGNVTHVLEVGPAAALTGPVERGDLTTLRKHLTVCSSAEERQRYLLLSQLLLQLAKEKNPQRDYGTLDAFLLAAEDGHVV